MSGRTFVLSKSPLKYLTGDFYKENRDITVLDLSNTNVGYLAPEISLLKDLEVLDISNTSISIVPLEIGDLKKLREFRYDNASLITSELYSVLDLGKKETNFLKLIQESSKSDKSVAKLEYLKPKKNKDLEEFDFLSWNILADHATRPQWFCLCKSQYMAVEYRLNNIIRKITNLQPDILCLQEVEADLCRGEFMQKMQTLGYTWTYAPKGRFSSRPFSRQGSVPGQATLFKSNRFELVNSTLIEPRYSMLIKEHLQEINNCDDAVLFTLIRSKKTPARYILVVNVHMFYRNSDIRRVFADIIINEGKNFARMWVRDFDIILAGDFNDQSGSPSINNFIASDERFVNVYDSMGIVDNVTANSIYCNTNRIDHIIATNGLKPISTLKGLTKEEMIEKFPVVPCKDFPSDHFPVGAVFKFV